MVELFEKKRNQQEREQSIKTIEDYCKNAEGSKK